MAIKMYQGKPYAPAQLLVEHEGTIFLTNLLIDKLDELDKGNTEARERLEVKINELMELNESVFGSGF